MAPIFNKADGNFKILVDGSDITLENSKFLVNDQIILSQVPDNISATSSRYTTRDKPVTSTPGCFVGFKANEAQSHHVVPIGKLKDIKFMSIFQFKVWWTTHWTGTNGRDLEHETQMVILDKSDSLGRPYVLFLPVRSGLLSSPERTTSSTFASKVGPVKLPETPSVAYCTCMQVMIRTAWLKMQLKGINRTSAGEQMPCRLIKFQENYKFRDYVSPRSLGQSDPNNKGMGAFIKDLKEEFNTVDFVYVGHALCGYWGGLRPGVSDLPESKVIRPKLTPGLEKTMEDLAVDKIVYNGIGLVPPEIAEKLYEGLHSHLESVGIDGVKVESFICWKCYVRIMVVELIWPRLIIKPVKKHFNGNGVIASMEHCNDFMLLGTETIALGRVGDDFWCTDPSGDPNGTFWLQGCHMVHCAYNSLWMGNFIGTCFSQHTLVLSFTQLLELFLVALFTLVTLLANTTLSYSKHWSYLMVPSCVASIMHFPLVIAFLKIHSIMEILCSKFRTSISCWSI